VSAETILKTVSDRRPSHNDRGRQLARKTLGEAFLVDLPDAPEKTKFRDRIERLLALAVRNATNLKSIALSVDLSKARPKPTQHLAISSETGLLIKCVRRSQMRRVVKNSFKPFDSVRLKHVATASRIRRELAKK